jgi:Flp pilus assembly protein TadG
MRRQGDKGTRRIRNWRGQVLYKRKGQAYVEFIIVLPLLLIIIAGVIGYGQALYTKLAMEAAAWSACRHAIATLDASRGLDQAFRATRHTLMGFGLNPDSAQVHVSMWGEWDRGTRVQAQVCYDVPSPPVPLGEVLVPQLICARQTMPVYKWKSRW